jgi:hypothetical protein
MGAALALDIGSGSKKALGFFPIPRAARVLYVQIEDTKEMTAKRLSLLARRQITPNLKTVCNLKILTRCPLDLMDPSSFAGFEAELKRFKPEVIIFDVFRRLFHGNVLDAKDTADFLKLMDKIRDEWDCATVMVHHARKGESPEIQTRALGSVNLTAWADVLVFLTGKRQLGAGSVSDIAIDSKGDVASEKSLVIRVDETRVPMVRVLDQERCDIGVLRACVRKNPGLNQKELIAASGFGEKKLCPLLKAAIEKGLLCVKRGNRKSLKYFIPRKR